MIQGDTLRNRLSGMAHHGKLINTNLENIGLLLNIHFQSLQSEIEEQR